MISMATLSMFYESEFPKIKIVLLQTIFLVGFTLELYVFNSMSLFGYKRVYLPLCQVADTPFHIKGDDNV